MNRKIYLLFIFIGCCCIKSSAQNDSINWLDEVVLSDVKLTSNSSGQLVKELNDSLIQQNEPFLTSLLKFNSPFYFRENGYGMVSSASVRGTGAAQTAVIWNGININSQFTGQTDFNAINTQVFQNVSVKPGGGSVVYGSGAIGGTIHLNNEFKFGDHTSHNINLGYGGFETYKASYTGNFSNENTSLSIGAAGIRSANDYPYLDTEAFNENGDFHNASVNVSMAHWLDKSNILKLFSNYYEGERGFSGTLNINSNSKYSDQNSRNLLEWKYFTGRLTSSVKLAWIKEEFKYYENRDSRDFSQGDANTALIKYDLGYELSENKKLNFIADYNDISGNGSGIDEADRKIGGLSLLWTQKIEDVQYQLSLRQEITNAYNSPLLFSAGLQYYISDPFSLRINTSRNFRIPTLNDLYWQNGGNPDLEPETSLQAEIGFGLKLKDLKVDLNTYYIDINELIRWVPDNSGTWRPLNTAEVYNYGAEIFADWKIDIFGNPLDLNGNYAYTRSIDKESNKQLIYIPEHKAALSATYAFSQFLVYLQSLYNGSIFTSTDNLYQLEDYVISNLGVGYAFGREPVTTLNFQINNLFNEKYQSLPSRIMPGRSFSTTLIIKF